MAEIDTILNQICQILESQETDAVYAAYEPVKMLAYEKPVITVGLKHGAITSSGFLEYLGLQYDAVHDREYELFGKRMEMTLELSVFAPKADENGAESCLHIFDLITEQLVQLPDGMHLQKLSCGETVFDEKMKVFRLPAEMQVAVYLYTFQDDNGVFSDFVLKGDMV